MHNPFDQLAKKVGIMTAVPALPEAVADLAALLADAHERAVQDHPTCPTGRACVGPGPRGRLPPWVFLR